jgi:nucleoside-diphosphate-sugar epimerase
MRVFVAGAGGVIGRRLLPLLREAGHEVTGTTRSAGRVGQLRSLGAAPVVVDVFDAAAPICRRRPARPRLPSRLSATAGCASRARAISSTPRKRLACGG